MFGFVYKCLQERFKLYLGTSSRWKTKHHLPCRPFEYERGQIARVFNKIMQKPENNLKQHSLVRNFAATWCMHACKFGYILVHDPDYLESSYLQQSCSDTLKPFDLALFGWKFRSYVALENMFNQVLLSNLQLMISNTEN